MNGKKFNFNFYKKTTISTSKDPLDIKGMGIDLTVEKTLAVNDLVFMQENCHASTTQEDAEQEEDVESTFLKVPPSSPEQEGREDESERQNNESLPSENPAFQLFSDWVVALLNAVYTQYHYPDGTDGCDADSLLKLGEGLDVVKDVVPNINNVLTVRTLGYLGCLLQHEKYLQRGDALERLIDFLLAIVARCEVEIQNLDGSKTENVKKNSEKTAFNDAAKNVESDRAAFLSMVNSGSVVGGTAPIPSAGSQGSLGDVPLPSNSPSSSPASQKNQKNTRPNPDLTVETNASTETSNDKKNQNNTGDLSTGVKTGGGDVSKGGAAGAVYVKPRSKDLYKVQWYNIIWDWNRRIFFFSP